MPPRTTTSGSSRLARLLMPTPSQCPISVTAATATGSPASARASTSATAAPPRRSWTPALRRSAASPTSVSQHPTRPAPALRTVRVDHHVSRFAGVAGRAQHRAPSDDQSRADADLPGHEHHVVVAATGAASVLPQRSEVRLVADPAPRPRAGRGRPRACLPRPTPLQPEVGRHVDEPVRASGQPGDGDAHPGDPAVGRIDERRQPAPPPGRTAAAGDTVAPGSSTRRWSRTAPPRPMTAAATDSTPSSIASATAPSDCRCTMGDGRPGPELADTPCSVTSPRPASSWTSTADGRAVEAGGQRQLRARGGTAEVQVLEDGTEVVPSSGRRRGCRRVATEPTRSTAPAPCSMASSCRPRLAPGGRTPP